MGASLSKLTASVPRQMKRDFYVLRIEEQQEQQEQSISPQLEYHRSNGVAWLEVTSKAASSG